MKDLFNNRSATKTFAALFFGFVVILIASMFVFANFQNYMQQRMSRSEFSYAFMRGISLARAIQPKKLRYHLWELNARGLWFHLSDKPAKKSIIIKNSQYGKKVRKIALKHHRHLIASVPMQNGQWLIARGSVAEHPLFVLGAIMSTLLLTLALLLLCWWAVGRLALPASKFIKAAKRFGVDVHSPPMSVAGSPELKEVIVAYNEMQERIRRLIHDRTQMLAAISHDLRTPITRLQLRAEYLQGTPQYEKAVADLDEMEQMISSILSFARDYSSEEQMERFDVNALLQSLCDEMVDVGKKVIYKTEGDRVVFNGRLSALKRAFSNLVENAIKYGGVADVTLHMDEQKIQVRVSDKGPGIPESEMEKVFAPFYRVDKSRTPQKAGSGLGLAVARDIIRTHGGDIRLHNREPKGLVVIVDLPIT